MRARWWLLIGTAVALVVAAGVVIGVRWHPAPPEVPPPGGGVVLRYSEVGPGGGGGAGLLAVTPDGLASTLRDGEKVTLAIGPDEVDRLRRAVTAALTRLDRVVDRSGGRTDQPFAIVTVVGVDGLVRQVRFEGYDRDGHFDPVTDRLAGLIRRVAIEGGVDRSAPVFVTRYEPDRRDPEPAGTWPATVPPPAAPGAFPSSSDRTYRGADAMAVRAALGPPQVTVVLLDADRTPMAVRWIAVLPGFP